MNSIALVLSLLVVTSGVWTASQDAWTQFKARHGKLYENQQVESLRREIFYQTKARIDKFNAERAHAMGYRLGLNHLADRTQAELDRLAGARVPAELLASSLGRRHFIDKLLADDSIEVPAELDWRKTPGRVSPVKDQGSCGSCWAFAAVGALEGQTSVRNVSLPGAGSLVELSEQNLVDCVGPQGCRGGWMSEAFDYVHKNNGINDENSYPYEANDKLGCRYNKAKKAFSDAGWEVLPEGDEEALKKMVAAFGPVSVGIYTNTDFHYYESGVFQTDWCPNRMENLNHGVLVVGYGTDPKQGDYWIVKNSWSDEWGLDGYILMARNKHNWCGIATVATIPTF